MNWLTKKILGGFAFGGALFGGLLVAQVITGAIQLSQDPRGNFGITSAGDLLLQNQVHINSNAASAPPVVSTCTGGTLVAGSTDYSGGVAGVTGTACTVTFGRAYVNAPICTFSGSNATAGVVSGAVTNTAIVFAFTTASSARITWSCVGNIV